MSDITTKVSDFCTAIEDVTDELTHTAGSVTTKIAPLLATFASGLSVLFAVWDGIGALLQSRVPDWAYWISFVIGLIIMLGLEGVSLASVFNTDRTKALNATRPDNQQLEEGALPGWMLALTMLIVFCTEVAPTFARWVNSAVSTSDLVFAFGLLALPLLGRAGAVIFSNSRTLDGLDGAETKRQTQKDKRRQADLDLEIKRRKAELELEQDKAEHAQKLELQREKEQAKLQKSAQPIATSSTQQMAHTPEQPLKVAYDEDKLRQLVQLLETHGDISNELLGQHLAVHKTTVGRWVDILVDAKVLDKVGRKKVLNGHHKQFLAGATLTELGLN